MGWFWLTLADEDHLHDLGGLERPFQPFQPFPALGMYQYASCLWGPLVATFPRHAAGLAQRVYPLPRGGCIGLLPISQLDLTAGICYTRYPHIGVNSRVGCGEAGAAPWGRHAGRGVVGKRPFGSARSGEQSSWLFSSIAKAFP